MNHDQVISMLKSAKDSITLQVTQGEQTPVSVSGRSSSTRGVQPPDVGKIGGSTEQTPAAGDNNVFEEDG